MNILITILLIIVSIIVLLLVIALFIRKQHYVKREIIIDVPSQKAFDYLKLIGNQEKFNKHAMVSPDRIKEFKGTDGEVGFIYSWRGNKNAGEGEKEIRHIIDGKKIECEIRFVKPMKVSATMIIETEPLSNVQTKVFWSNAGTLNYPVNIFIPMMEKNVARDMDESLKTLKNILEKQS